MRSDNRPGRPLSVPAAEAVDLLYADSDSRRPFRWALAGAAVLHAALLLSPLRYTVEAAPDPEAPKVFVVQQPRFKPPPVELEREIPPERARLVPVPDPDPTDPEPIRPIRELSTPLDLPDTDWVGSIPDAPPPPEPTGPLRIGGPVSRPVKTAGEVPLYPEVARRVKRECTVMLQTVIDVDGRVVDIQPLQTCPLGMTEAAVEAVESWRYRPALRGGKPVAVYMQLRVDFTLH